MLTIYCEVRKQESKTKKYNRSITESGRSNNVPQRIDHSRRFANQAMFYVLSFWLTWLFPTCTRISQFITGGSSPFAFIALFCIFIPLQGFFNVIVYLRPRYLKFKKEHSDKNICQLLFMGCCGGNGRRRSIFHVSGQTTAGEFSRIEKSAVSRVEEGGGQSSTFNNIEDEPVEIRRKSSVMFEDEEEPNEMGEESNKKEGGESKMEEAAVSPVRVSRSIMVGGVTADDDDGSFNIKEEEESKMEETSS